MVGRFVHASQNVFSWLQRDFFYPKGLAKTKVENFATIMNIGSGDNFFRRFSIQMTSNQLDALLAEMETAIDIPDNIPKAVSVVGKNISPRHGKAIWAFNKDLFVDEKGNIVKPDDHGFVWIGHLVKSSHNETANEERQATVN